MTYRSTQYFLVKAPEQTFSFSMDGEAWATTPSNERKLARAFAKGSCVLIFAANQAHHFHGYCEMTSAPGTRDPPAGSGWGDVGFLGGVFGVSWRCYTRLPFRNASHLKNSWNKNQAVSKGRDITPIEPGVARELCRLLDECAPLNHRNIRREQARDDKPSAGNGTKVIVVRRLQNVRNSNGERVQKETVMRIKRPARRGELRESEEGPAHWKGSAESDSEADNNSASGSYSESEEDDRRSYSGSPSRVARQPTLQRSQQKQKQQQQQQPRQDERHRSYSRDSQSSDGSFDSSFGNNQRVIPDKISSSGNINNNNRNSNSNHNNNSDNSYRHSRNSLDHHYNKNQRQHHQKVAHSRSRSPIRKSGYGNIHPQHLQHSQREYSSQLSQPLQHFQHFQYSQQSQLSQHQQFQNYQRSLQEHLQHLQHVQQQQQQQQQQQPQQQQHQHQHQHQYQHQQYQQQRHRRSRSHSREQVHRSERRSRSHDRERRRTAVDERRGAPVHRERRERQSSSDNLQYKQFFQGENNRQHSVGSRGFDIYTPHQGYLSRGHRAERQPSRTWQNDNSHNQLRSRSHSRSRSPKHKNKVKREVNHHSSPFIKKGKIERSSRSPHRGAHPKNETTNRSPIQKTTRQRSRSPHRRAKGLKRELSRSPLKTKAHRKQQHSQSVSPVKTLRANTPSQSRSQSPSSQSVSSNSERSISRGTSRSRSPSRSASSNSSRSRSYSQSSSHSPSPPAQVRKSKTEVKKESSPLRKNTQITSKKSSKPNNIEPQQKSEKQSLDKISSSKTSKPQTSKVQSNKEKITDKDKLVEDEGNTSSNSKHATKRVLRTGNEGIEREKKSRKVSDSEQLSSKEPSTKGKASSTAASENQEEEINSKTQLEKGKITEELDEQVSLVQEVSRKQVKKRTASVKANILEKADENKIHETSAITNATLPLREETSSNSNEKRKRKQDGIDQPSDKEDEKIKGISEQTTKRNPGEDSSSSKSAALVKSHDSEVSDEDAPLPSSQQIPPTPVPRNSSSERSAPVVEGLSDGESDGEF